MKVKHDVRYQRIGEGLAAIPALQKPFCHRLKIPPVFYKKHTGGVKLLLFGLAYLLHSY
jgi:hypothetical protein